MQRLLSLLSLIALAMLAAIPLSASAQSGTTPQLLLDTTLSDSRNDKFPDIATSGQMVMIGGGVSKDGSKDNTTALTWVFGEQAMTIGAGTDIGPAQGKPDYSSVAAGADASGNFYAAWSSIDDRTIYLRRRDTAGNWGPQRTVTSGGFPIFARVDVSTSGTLFVAWQDVGLPVFLKVSSDQGASFSNTFSTTEKAYSSPSTIAIGPNNAVAIGFTTGDLAAAVATWNGAGLNPAEIITAPVVAADVSASFGPDGKLYAAWRGLEASGTNSGVYYAERQAANSWQQRQLVSGEVKGRVNVAVDDGGAVHLGWISNVSGGPRFFYTFRAAGQSQFATAVATNSTSLFNSRLALSSGGAFAHVALENFSGSSPFITYARFAGSSGGGPQATPVINGGSTTLIGRSPTVTLTFLSVSGDPTQIRWRWGSAPTDASNDSGGWQTFESQKTVSVPDAILNAATCTPLQLFTQVRDANQTLGDAKSASVTMDTGVTAAVVLSNPHMQNKASQFSNLNATLGDYNQDGGASDGHPNYTRDPGMYVNVQAVSECSGLEDVATGRSTTTIAPAVPMSKDSFSNVLPLPGIFQVGDNSVLLRVSDKVGNTKDYTQTLVFDVTPPVLDTTAGSFSATAHTDATILTSLKFANIAVTDNAYPGRGFWGVWVANSRTPVQDPATDSNLIWYPIAAPGSATSFTITSWSLASGLDAAALTAGDYYVYVRFLDGAGNPTAASLSTQVNLSQVSFPQLNLPVVRR